MVTGVVPVDTSLPGGFASAAALISQVMQGIALGEERDLPLGGWVIISS